MTALIAPFPEQARTYTAALLGLLLAACIAAWLREPTPPMAEVIIEVEAEPFAMNAKWSKPTATSGCWYFAGPAPYGRDFTHGSSALATIHDGNITLAFGGAVFTGAVAPEFVLRHEGGGPADGWLYTETLTGTELDDRVEAVYRYTECRLDQNGGCSYVDQGDCAIDAKVTLTAP